MWTAAFFVQLCCMCWSWSCLYGSWLCMMYVWKNTNTCKISKFCNFLIFFCISRNYTPSLHPKRNFWFCALQWLSKLLCVLMHAYSCGNEFDLLHDVCSWVVAMACRGFLLAWRYALVVDLNWVFFMFIVSLFHSSSKSRNKWLILVVHHTLATSFCTITQCN